MFKWVSGSDIVSQVPVVIEAPTGLQTVPCPTCGITSWGRRVIALSGYVHDCHRDDILAYKMPTCGCLIDATRFRLEAIVGEVTYEWKEVLPK